MNQIESPIKPKDTEAVVLGNLTYFTSRDKPKGEPGDWFNFEGKQYQIHTINKNGRLYTHYFRVV